MALFARIPGLKPLFNGRGGWICEYFININIRGVQAPLGRTSDQ